MVRVVVVLVLGLLAGLLELVVLLATVELEVEMLVVLGALVLAVMVLARLGRRSRGRSGAGGVRSIIVGAALDAAAPAATVVVVDGDCT